LELTTHGELTQGTLLGGRVRYDQPATGFRNGIEPVLLAASVKARPGQRVLEAGTGAGAALLCLTARVGGLDCTGVERDAGLSGLARANAAANRAPIEIVTIDITAGDITAGDITAGDITAGLAAAPSYHHAIANPPWHRDDATASPDPRRDDAKRGRPGLVAAWALALASVLRPGGTLTMILPAACIGQAFAAFAACGCGDRTVAPLWPKVGRAAKIVLIHGVRRSRGADRVMPGLVLHEPGGAFTAAAESILREGAAWAFDQPTSSG